MVRHARSGAGCDQAGCLGVCLGLLGNGLHGIADGALLVIVIPPAFQKGQILASTVVCGFQQDLQSVFDALRIKLAQQFGTALIHAL